MPDKIVKCENVNIHYDSSYTWKSAQSVIVFLKYNTSKFQINLTKG